MEDNEILFKYADGLLTKEEAMSLVNLKKAAFNSRMRDLGYSSSSHFFPTNKKLIPKNDLSFWVGQHARYLNGSSISEIANDLGLRSSTVKERFIYFELKLRSYLDTRKLAIDKSRSTNEKLYGTPFPNQNEDIKKKTKNTLMAKYGVDNISKLDVIKKDISRKVKESSEKAKEKRYDTNTKKYGYKHSSQKEEIKLKTIKNNLSKYGSSYPTSNPIVREKIEETNLKKYGSNSPLSNKEVIEKRVITVIENNKKKVLDHLKDFNYELLDKYSGLFETIKGIKGYKKYNIKHTKCGRIFKDDVFLIPRCKECFPIQGKFSGQLQHLLNEYIQSLGCETVFNSRDILRNTCTGKYFEIDIFIKDKSLALEIDTLYHHSNKATMWGKPVRKNYHKEKTDSANNSKIKLLHIWEDWDLDIIKSIIRNELGISERYNARDLEVKEMDCSNFFKENHVYGSAKSFYQIALLKGDEILCAMSFRRCSEGIELARFASKIGCSIRGGFSRLLKNSHSKLGFKELITYCDRDLSPIAENTVYFKNGFTLVGDTGPRLFYTDFRKRWSREKFQKKKLKTLFPESYREDLTSQDILSKEKIYSIWNSGNWKFKMSF